MIYIILDPEDGFIHMVTTDKDQAKQEFRDVENLGFELREYVDESK
jgi:hypothetical protein